MREPAVTQWPAHEWLTAKSALLEIWGDWGCFR